MRYRLCIFVFAGVLNFGNLPVQAQETASLALYTPTGVTGAHRSSSFIDSTVSKSGSTTQVLKTRCLDTGLLRIGSAYVFQVVEPMTLGNQAFVVGDLIHAHVEKVQGVAGRVFMRTDRVICAKTQQTTPLSMVATEQARQPGVGIPHMLDGWKLNWEQL